MYSPKIADDLITPLYQMAKKKGLPMTKIVDQLLRPQVLKPKKDIMNEFKKNSYVKGE